MVITENLQTKVAADYDVAVCGGGFAGIAAALAAARTGKKTVLFERQFILGGLGTAGLVTIYLPLCDGLGRQVSFGIAEELFRLSVSHGAEGMYPQNWLCGVGTRGEKDKRFEVQYNPHVFAISAEELLEEAGVDILYGTYVTGVKTEGGKISHVITESKSGRLAYGVKSVVDASGDCDIARFAGAPTDVFRQGNILAAWYYSVGKDGYRLHALGAADIPDEHKKPDYKPQLLDRHRFSGLDAEEISRFVSLSHKAVYADFLKLRQNDGTFLPVNIATVPQFRMTRKIVGEYVLPDEPYVFRSDSVGMVSNWKQRGPVYEVPFRSLYSASVKNLICAGRCVSSTETMWDVMRVIPCCAVTGQAAGCAAALSDDFTALDVNVLQSALRKQGVVLHISDLPRAAG